MATYWHLDLDLPLKDGVEDAAALAARAFSSIEHESSGDHLWRQCLVRDGFAFTIAESGEDDIDVSSGSLRLSFFLSNADRDVDEDAGDHRPRFVPLLEALGTIADAAPGLIVGALGSDHSTALGPIVATSAGLRWMPSESLSSSGDHFWNEDPETTIRSLPTDAIIDEGDGWTCRLKPGADLRPTPTA